MLQLLQRKREELTQVSTVKTQHLPGSEGGGGIGCASAVLEVGPACAAGGGGPEEEEEAGWAAGADPLLVAAPATLEGGSYCVVACTPSRSGMEESCRVEQRQ